MGTQAVIPAAIGEAVNAMVSHGLARLWAWSMAVLALGVVQAVAGALRHRRAVTNFLTAAVRVDQLVVRQAVRLGESLNRRVGEGEVASVGTTDVVRIGRVLDVTARGTGAIVSYAVVAVIMLHSSVELGLVVLIGAPVGGLLATPVLRPLERRQWAERQARGAASEVAADTVAGLRVLRGLGGEADFNGRYLAASQSVRRATVRTAMAQSTLDALQVFVPGVILVSATYVGAHLVLHGRISPGALVADYAYAAFLVLPVRTLMEMASYWSAGTVAAGRVLSVLRLQPELADPFPPAPEPGPGPLVDNETGLVVEAGRLTAVVVPNPEDAAALADRLGRHVDAPAGVTLAGTRLDALPMATVRRRVLVMNRDPHLLAGTIEGTVDVPGPTAPGEATAAGGKRRAGRRHRLPEPPAALAEGDRDDGRPSVTEAIEAAAAGDIVDGMDGGLQAPLSERGRSLSGGQRQRLLLAAALRADPDVLVLHEPTSAVDAHTEALIAERLAEIRRGRTTVVLATSPLLLARADTVVMLGPSGREEGTHTQLLASSPEYRQMVAREMI
jgi:ABC-type multidrug transport system fused ATPase/permease subunit